MTDNERVLHTVLSECVRLIPEATGNRIGVLQARITYLENRLEEIEMIVTEQIKINARKNKKFVTQQ